MKEITKQLVWWWDERTERIYTYNIERGMHEYGAVAMAVRVTRPVDITNESVYLILGRARSLDNLQQIIDKTISILDWMKGQLIFDEVLLNEQELLRLRYIIDDVDNIRKMEI